MGDLTQPKPNHPPSITMSLLPLPAELRWSWTSWTQLIHGNVDIVVFALTLR